MDSGLDKKVSAANGRDRNNDRGIGSTDVQSQRDQGILQCGYQSKGARRRVDHSQRRGSSKPKFRDASSYR